MLSRLLDFLTCPECGSKFKLHIYKSQKSKQITKLKDKINIVEGLLECSCGALYPIIDSVPRMISDAFKENSKFYHDNETEINSKIGNNFSKNLPKSFKSTQKSFGQQWMIFDYSDRTWARTSDERRKEVLIHFNQKESEFKNKLLLDIGCGNGIEAAVITDFGCEVVAMDLSDSIIRANKEAIKFRKKNLAPVHYVQANLMNPPFKNKTFDFVSSSGVLHHTPNTKKAFDKVAPLCKGKLWIWLYQREKWIATLIEISKIITRRIPLRFQYYICYITAPIYQLLKSFLNLTGLGKYPNMTFRENVVSLSDTLTPAYAFNHTPKEVTHWYKEAGFKHIKETWRDRCGFGILGTKI